MDDGGETKQTNTIDLTKTYFNLTFFFEVNLTAVTWMHCSWLGGRDYQTVLTNTKFYPLLWTISAMFLISCSVPCFDVLFCSSFDYSSLNSSVLWHILLGWGTDYRTALKKKSFLNYSTNGSYYSFLDCGVLYVDVLLCSALDCSNALLQCTWRNCTWVGDRISDCN